MPHNVYIYLFIMGAVTYLVRVLPLTLIRCEITNKYIKAFLYYVPYVTLAVMTFPSIIEATGKPLTAMAALAAASALAWYGGSLFQVAALSCAVVFVLDRFVI